MGYECPVCDAEEADGEHLANHLAFTALVRGGDHEAFLDEHVPDWETMDPESLAASVAPQATETDTEPVTEPRNHEHHDRELPAGQRTAQPDLSGETAAILDDAVELTQAMRESRVANPDPTGMAEDVDADGDDEAAERDDEGADGCDEATDGGDEAADGGDDAVDGGDESTEGDDEPVSSASAGGDADSESE